MKKQALLIFCVVVLLLAQATQPAYTLKEATAGSPLHAE